MKKVMLFILVFCAFSVQGQTLLVKFTHVRNNQGVFRVGFYINEETYKDGDPVYYLTVPKTNFENGTVIYSFKDIPCGTYGLLVLDDENANDKTDYSFFLPKEGVGFSNYVIDKIKIPRYNDFAFAYTNTLMVTVDMKYL